MASSRQGRRGWSTALEAILVAAVLVALSPLLLVLLGWKVLRKVLDWRRSSPDRPRRNASWGVFVSG